MRLTAGPHLVCIVISGHDDEGDTSVDGFVHSVVKCCTPSAAQTHVGNALPAGNGKVAVSGHEIYHVDVDAGPIIGEAGRFVTAVDHDINFLKGLRVAIESQHKNKRPTRKVTEEGGGGGRRRGQEEEDDTLKNC